MNELYEQLKDEAESREAKKARVNLYLDSELKEKLQVIAEYQGESLNQKIGGVLAEWVKDFEKNYAKQVAAKQSRE